MNEARFNSIFEGQTSAAKKVYESIPIQEAWTTAQVMGELRRRGRTVDKRATEGILRSLRDSGIVAEPRPGQWVRVPIRVSTGNSKAEHPFLVVGGGEDEKPAEAKTPLDKLADLSARLLQAAEGLRCLAREIDNVALEVASQMDSAGEEAKKLRQLRSLLKDLG